MLDMIGMHLSYVKPAYIIEAIAPTGGAAVGGTYVRCHGCHRAHGRRRGPGLIDAGVAVRVVVRDRAKAVRWAKQGAEVAVADLADAAALTRAFAGAHGAYLVKPPNYALANLFEHADVTARAVAEAVRAAGLPKLVLLSSVGADRPSGTGVIATNRTAEQRLAELGIPVVFLRAAYFMENWARVVEPMRTRGILPSLLVPVERAIPMVATEDIGRVAADLLREDWTGIRKIGLEGPAAYSPADIAAIFARALDRPVRPTALEPSGGLAYSR